MAEAGLTKPLESMSFRSQARVPSVVLGLAAAIGIITLAHYVTPIHHGVLHNVYQRLYYLPIFAAAYWFGVRGAVIVSLLSAASYLPHILADWTGFGPYREAQFAELIMFQVVGLVVGVLAESAKKQRERQERTARELAEAYRRLQESFEQIQRADRLSALGELSAGLAHEIKNPLASMKGSVDILAGDFSPEHPKREFLDILDKEIGRLNDVLTAFLQFARTPRPERQPCHVREILESIRTLCAQEASRQGVDIRLQCDKGVPELFLDASQIQQALLNIVLNGIQAMPSGGRLDVVVDRTSRHVRIRIRDEGPGVPPEVRSRIFDPFFTTKERGTGLGMAMAHKFIHGNGGEIRLLEDVGPGAAFEVILPIESKTHE